MRVTFYLDVYREKICITAYDCPFVCETIVDPEQADKLVDLINQATSEARGYKE